MEFLHLGFFCLFGEVYLDETLRRDLVHMIVMIEYIDKLIIFLEPQGLMRAFFVSLRLAVDPYRLSDGFQHNMRLQNVHILDNSERQS